MPRPKSREETPNAGCDTKYRTAKFMLLCTKCKGNFLGTHRDCAKGRSLAPAGYESVERHPELIAELVALHQNLMARAGDAQMRHVLDPA